MAETAVDQVEFRNAMARFASGVTIVTARDDDGRPVGFTASAFSSLSLDPPLVLVCLEKRADSWEAFSRASHIGISILAEDQWPLALHFSTKGIDKFEDAPLVSGDATALPLVQGALVHLECRVYDRPDGGDHTILIGEVLRAASFERAPLLHYNRQAGRFVAQ